MSSNYLYFYLYLYYSYIENLHRRCLRQAGQGPDQSERNPHRAAAARDPPHQDLRAHPPARH